MDESLLVRFQSPARSLNVVSFRPGEGIVFRDHPDASPLIVGIGVQPLFPRLLDPVRQRHDWRENQFSLDASQEAGALRLSGYQGDHEGLPPGTYDVTVEVESFRFCNSAQRVIIRNDRQTRITLTEEPDDRHVRLRDNIDALTLAVLDHARSVIDGQPVKPWLSSPTPRAARQACLLNVLAKLRVPSSPSRGFRRALTSCVQYVYFADVDRVYAAATPDLPARLQELVGAGLWVCEGPPTAPIHELLRTSLIRIGVAGPDAQRFSLVSYRQGGRNCLQIVVAIPPQGFADPTVYADIDIDLGNPLWDLEGLMVHFGELLDTGRTDHLALRKSLLGGPASEFIYYDIQSA